MDQTAQTPDFFTSAEAGKAGFRVAVNKVLNTACVGLSFLTLIPLFSIVFLVVKNGLPLVSWSLFTETPPAAGMTGGGLGNALVGTLVMVGLGLLLATPLGILSAIYVNEYAPNGRLSALVRFVAKLLTGIPSIICGVFAYGIIVSTTGGYSAYAGGVALAVLMLPTILITCEQSLISVQNSYREASYGLGATKFQTITRIVLPDALSGSMTGIMLAVARAAGETAPLIFTASFSYFWARTLSEPTASLSVLVYNFAQMNTEYQQQMAWSAALVLVFIVTITNVITQLTFRKKH